MIKKYTTDQFFEEFVLNQEDLEKLEDATGISTEKAREIWKLIRKLDMANFDAVHDKYYYKPIKDIVSISGLSKVEIAYAGYLLGLRQSFKFFFSAKNVVSMMSCPNCRKKNIVLCHGGINRLKISGIEFLCQDCHCEF